MGSMSEILAPAGVRQCFATVVAVDGDIRVSSGSAEWVARRAAGCLLRPEPGDRVLVALGEAGEAYVLAVLERHSEGPATLALDGDARIEAGGGTLSLSARDGLNLESPAAVDVRAGSLRVNALDGEATVERLSLTAGLVHACAGRIRLVAESLDSFLERFYQVAKCSYRRVEELDDLKAGQIDHRARETVNIHGRHTLISAKVLVKVDGEQIHVG